MYAIRMGCSTFPSAQRVLSILCVESKHSGGCWMLNIMSAYKYTWRWRWLWTLQVGYTTSVTGETASHKPRRWTDRKGVQYHPRSRNAEYRLLYGAICVLRKRLHSMYISPCPKTLNSVSVSHIPHSVACDTVDDALKRKQVCRLCVLGIYLMGYVFLCVVWSYICGLTIFSIFATVSRVENLIWTFRFYCVFTKRKANQKTLCLQFKL